MTQIVLIDDDDLLRGAALALLKRWYKVIAFANPLDALIHIRGLTTQDCVILCDHDMPQLTGLEVYERLTVDLQRRFVLHTGNTDVSSPSGYTVYKPCSVHELRATIEKANAA